MKRKLYDLQSQRAAHVKSAEAALAAGDNAGYDAAMKEIDALNLSIERVEKLLGEQNRYGEPEQKQHEMAPPPSPEVPGEEGCQKQLDALRGSKEYTRAFLKAMRSGARVGGAYHSDLEPLYKALTISGGDPVGSDGGFLVPIDFETRVITLAREYVDLSTLVHVENVSTVQGWRNIEESAGCVPLPLVEEDAEIPFGEQLKVRRVNYSCKTHGDRLGISGELMANAGGLMEYLAHWFAPRYVATKNAKILAVLNALEFSALHADTDAEKVRLLKHVLNKELRTAHSRRACIVTNQNGYDDMDCWSDNDGRAFLRPDLSGDFEHFKGRRIISGDVSVLPDITESGETYAPLYVGDLASAVALFERSGMRMDVTNVGGDAWKKGGWEIRVLCSLDVQQLDPNAVVKRGLKYD